MFNKNLILIATTLLITYPNISKAEFSNDITNIKQEMWGIDYQQLKNCTNMLQRDCNIRLALNKMSYHNSLKNIPGEIDYEKAEQYLTPITGESLAARMLLGEIRMQQGNKKEAMALIASSGTEGFGPALDQLADSSMLVYAGQTEESSERQALKWQYKYYAKRKDPDIAYYIAAYFIAPQYKDCDAAKLWFTRATEGHNASIDAQHLLGEQYEAGNCVPQDYVMAYMMYDLGGTAAAKQKHALAEKMTREQINEGTLRSHQWQDENHSYRIGYGNDTPVYWNVHSSGN